jgi:hypothetical protein
MPFMVVRLKKIKNLFWVRLKFVSMTYNLNLRRNKIF